MKNLFLGLLVVSLVLFTSCGGDDDTVVIELGLSGALTFDGNEFSASDGLFAEAADGGAYAATFFISDAPLTYDDETNQTNFQGDFLVNLIIFKEGDAFEAGNYSIADLGSTIEDKSALLVYADADNVESGGVLAIGGTVNIQGSGDNYTLTFAIDFENDIELVGTVTGNFERIEIPVQ